MRFSRLTGVLFSVLLLASGAAFAQGLPSANLSGRVLNEGTGLPGALVAVQSANLQGTRSTTSSGAGDYVFPALPPGDYTISFELSGFATLKKSVRLAASQTVSLDANMSLSQVVAQAEVVAEAETISQGTQASTTYSADLLNKLPTTRTLLSAVVLSPGVNTNGPNAAVTISGGQSFDNLFTINGVVAVDNIRGTPFNLFIEDAIQETTTTTSSISAEVGRFTGGVVNAITKSGGNRFSGSFRSTLTNDAWSAETPAHLARLQTVIPAYEATLGGPAVKDRVWFFAAGRLQNNSFNGQTSAFGTYAVDTFTQTDNEKRIEGKLTLTPFQNHTLVGSYSNIVRDQGNYYFNASPILDMAQVYDRGLPQSLVAINYNGVLTNSFFVEGQYSNRKFTFQQSGGRFTDLIKGTPVRDRSRGFAFSNSPVFCGVCEDEERNNRDFLGKATYFLSTPSVGSHNIVVGYDNFSGSRLSNNHQSGSNYQFIATNTVKNGGVVFPIVDVSSYLLWYPISQLSQGSDVLTYSVFLNDQWRLNNNLSFNLGVRWDKNNAKDSIGNTTANDSAVSPRLAATYDVFGNSSLKFNVSYAKYVGGITETQVGAASPGGTPATFRYPWLGPNINTLANPVLNDQQALAQIFAFYGITAPGQAPNAPPNSASVPGVNVKILQSLVSPDAQEATVGVAGAIGSRGNFRVDAVYRKYGNFYSGRTDTTTGTVTSPTGTIFDLTVVENTDFVERKYTGLHTSFSYRLLDRLNLGGTWTWSHAIGNFEGETAGSGPVRTGALSYPEYRDPKWNNPVGDLGIDQRHRVRAFATYDLPIPRSVGIFTFSALHSFDTGSPYAAAGTVDTRPYVTNPGNVYRTPPTSVTYYFTSRDAFHTDNINRTDASLTYSKSIGPIELFLQPQVINVFNNQAFGGNFSYFNTTVETRVNVGAAAYAAFNPFTTTPVQGARGTPGANWNTGPTFGTVTSDLGYQNPRTFRLSVGARF